MRRQRRVEADGLAGEGSPRVRVALQSGHELRCLSLLRQQFDRLLIKRDKSFAAQPIALIGHDTIRKITASFEDRKAGLYRRTVHHDIACVQQVADCHGYICFRQLGATAQYPNELA